MAYRRMNRRYGVVGCPVAHSLSPWLHAHFARLTQRRVVYAAYQPSREHFNDFAAAFFRNGGNGLNVTLPFKADALRFADDASAFAVRTGAANVLKRKKDGSVKAYNTDGAGFISDLQARLPNGGSGKHIVLLGAGGAARAVAHAIAADKPATFRIFNRTPEKADALASAVGATAAQYPPEGADVVINATSAGFTDDNHFPPALFAGAAIAYDLSYGKAAVPFLRCARKGGADYVTAGEGMLVRQAALSFAIWEGVLPSAAAAIATLQRAAAIVR